MESYLDTLFSLHKKKDTLMPRCSLCTKDVAGKNYVCAPLGMSGDRCCERCSVTMVLPAREAADLKRSSPTEDLHIGKRMCKQFDWFESLTNDEVYDDDLELSRSQPSQCIDSDAYIASEAAADASLPGIEFEFPMVLPGLSAANCAVKPPCSRTRPGDLVIDVYIGFDNTYSMRGSGQSGLCTTVKNLPALVVEMFKKSKIDDDVDVANVRASTCVHMFKFGERATAFDDQPMFAPFTDDALRTSCEAVIKGMKFNDGETNIELAVQYASEKARERFISTRDVDEAEGKTRVACVVLLTDGSVNAGSRSAQNIIAGADARLSDSCRGQRLAFYAIGIGESTSPQFLTSFARGGFWKHVVDSYYPSSAFDTTIGAVLASVGVYSVSIRTDVERNGEVLADKSTITTKNFGLMTVESCRARILKVSIPPAALPGDVLVVNTRFWGLDGESFQSRIAVGTAENVPIVEANMSEGLFSEAQEIEYALEKLKTSIKNGHNLQDTTDSMVQSNAGSAAVQAQLQRYSEILDNSLSCTSSVGTMWPQSLIVPSRWMVESSLSQLDY